MFQNEVTFVLGVLVAAFILLNWSLMARLPRFPLLLAAYLVTVVAWAAAIGEGLQGAGSHLAGVFALAEHIGYLVSSVLIAIWCWTALLAKRGARP